MRPSYVIVQPKVQPHMIRITFARYASVLLVLGAATAGVVAAQTAPRPATPPAQAPAAPPTAAPAPPPAPVPFPPDAKIGFVNMQLVVSQSKLGKAGQDQMKTLYDKKMTELGAKNKEIQTLQQEIQTGGSVLSAAVLSQKQAELDRKTREAQFLQEQGQAETQTLEQNLLDEFSKKVLPIVEQIRAEKGLWVVFGLGEGTGIAAVNPGLDLTSDIVKRLDASK